LNFIISHQISAPFSFRDFIVFDKCLLLMFKNKIMPNKMFSYINENILFLILMLMLLSVGS
jgi:hypothetical protein